VEVGLDTSTIALQVIEGNEKEKWCLGDNWATVSLGNINTKTWSSWLGVGCKADETCSAIKKICCKIQK
jgi:hypothetical protein